EVGAQRARGSVGAEPAGEVEDGRERGRVLLRGAHAPGPGAGGGPARRVHPDALGRAWVVVLDAAQLDLGTGEGTEVHDRDGHRHRVSVHGVHVEAEAGQAMASPPMPQPRSATEEMPARRKRWACRAAT